MSFLRHAAAWGSFIRIMAASGSDGPVILPAITLWISAYLIGRASRERRPTVRVEGVDLEVHEYYPNWEINGLGTVDQRKKLNRAMTAPIPMVNDRNETLGDRAEREAHERIMALKPPIRIARKPRTR